MSLNTNYYFFISCNAETDCFLFPVLPEKVTYSDGIKNTSLTISNLGETTVIENPSADTISFSSRFPAYLDQSVVVDKLYEPTYYRNKLEKWRGYKKPVHFILSASFFCNDYYTIEELSYTDEGGPVGEIQYNIKLKKYTEATIRKIDLSPKDSTKAEVTDEKKKVDNTVQPTTYKVVKGDSLYKIAKAKLGNGNRWKEIYNLNKNIIKNPNKLQVGWVLKLPKK